MCEFQFHYGSIKSRCPMWHMYILTYFNSTMVRLKDAWIRPKVLSNIFQFHYGSIKRRSWHKIFQTANRFQFHYGSIKRYKGYKKLKQTADFNSTMVRLKVSNRSLSRQLVEISIPLWFD